MFEITIKGSEVIPAYNAVAALQAWLRPGLTSFIIGSHAEALKPHAVRLFTERDQMIDESALKYPEKYPDNEPDEAKRGQPHPMAGRRIVRLNDAGQEMTIFKSTEAGEEFRERDAALFATDVTIRVDMRITLELIRMIDRERLESPRMLNGIRAADNVVDFAGLLPLIDRNYTSSGIASSVPSTPIQEN
jgi:hypothetical protein